MNGTLVTNYKQLNDKQILDEVDKQMRVRDSQARSKSNIFKTPNSQVAKPSKKG